MKKILLIKQTSLGDVLHATGALHIVKQNFPDAELHLMTSHSCAKIVENNPHVDKLILLDRQAFKKNWYKKPLWAWNLMKQGIREIQAETYDLAIDLQGLAKTVIFLYAANAKQKYVKGSWPKLKGFDNRSLHAVKEIEQVLKLAGLEVGQSTMELYPGASEREAIDKLLTEINPRNLPIAVFSPYSRWQSKDWPISKYVELSDYFNDDYLILFTGADNRKPEIDSVVASMAHENVISLAGRLDILEFAELVSRAEFMLTGDSFPMHVSVAQSTPVVAIFGPTSEKKVGPIGTMHRVVRASSCLRCEKADCRRLCLYDLEVSQVRDALENQINRIAKIKAKESPEVS